MAKVTIKDVAGKLNITVGTVSKALNGRTGVSPELRREVERTARELGYNANPIARSLARSPITIGIIIPRIWQEFYGYLKAGIDGELSAMLDHRIEGKYIFLSGLNAIEEIRSALNEFRTERVDAVIICPAFDMQYGDEIDKLKASGIPVVILGNRMDSEAKLTAIYADSFKAGSMAADYASGLLRDDEQAAVFIGKSDVWDHREKVRGFTTGLADKEVQVYETYDKPEVAYELAARVVAEDRALRIIYVATGNSVAICRAIKDGGAAVRVIATDIFPEMREYVDAGIIIGVIFQDLIWQGKTAVRVLYDYITLGKLPPEEIRAVPQFALKSNFENYLNDTENSFSSGNAPI